MIICTAWLLAIKLHLLLDQPKVLKMFKWLIIINSHHRLSASIARYRSRHNHLISLIQSIRAPIDFGAQFTEARTFFNANQTPAKWPAGDPLMITHIIVSNRRLYQVNRELLTIILTPPPYASLFIFHLQCLLFHTAVMTTVFYGSYQFQFFFGGSGQPLKKYFLTVENRTKVMAKVC